LKKVLVTGADRGLGLALTEEFLKGQWTVFAGQYMKEWGELERLKSRYDDSLYVIPLDVSSDASVKEACETITPLAGHIDMLVNNAGISGSAGDIYEPEDFNKGLAIFNTNCVGPLRVTNTFLPLLNHLESLKRLCYVSSEAGSISVCHRSDGFIYPMSKTALNMAVNLLFNDLRPKGYTFRLYHPGWVRSYMSGKKSTQGKFEPEETAQSAVKFFLKEEVHEDVLRLVDNENVTWPF
jgi:NAD(P)-dependent dehydrogenase (short-subunit alcohol dehydrogenase family)